MLQRFKMFMIAMVLCVSCAIAAEQLTTPQESLGGMRPGILSVDQLIGKLGKPAKADRDGLLGLYGGAAKSDVYGWFMVQNPNYTVPDLVAETAKGSKRVDLLMAIGYDGLKTERGVACFQNESAITAAYGKPDFAFAVPMNGFVLRELYYPRLGLSFDVAPTGPSPDENNVIAIYVTYPEFLQRAIEMRQSFIRQGIGKDVTVEYAGGRST